MLISYYTNLIGYVFLGEIFGVFYVIVMWPKLPRNVVVCMYFAIIWAGVQLLSDFLNKTDVNIALKGVFAPIILISTIIFFYDAFLKYPKKVVSFLLGFTLGLGIITSIFQFQLIVENPWKWVLGVSINSLFALWYSYYSKQRIILLIIFVFLFFLISNVFSARSVSLFALLSALLFILLRNNKVSYYLSKNYFNNFFRFKIIFYFVLIFYLLNLAGSLFYSSDFYTNNLSEEEKNKVFKQAKSSYGILLGGRSEGLISVKAFLDKPLLGHGSWAKDDGNYINDFINIIEDTGSDMGDNDFYFDLNYIPVHSYIFGALVWAGIFAGLFWIHIILKIFKMIFLYGNQLNYFTVYIMVSLIWNIFFSPFGYNHRWESAFRIAYLLYIENLLKSNFKNSI